MLQGTAVQVSDVAHGPLVTALDISITALVLALLLLLGWIAKRMMRHCARVRRRSRGLETVPKERVCTYLFYINIFETLKSFILSHIKFSLHVKFPSKNFCSIDAYLCLLFYT